MVHYNRRSAFVAAVAALLVLVGSLGAVAPEIRDDGKFFSAPALKKADERIRDIYRLHHLDVLIETFTTVPAADADKVKAMDADKRNEYYLQWAKDRATERVVKGVYVLICKEPHVLRVGLIDSSLQKLTGFREAVETAFRNEFKENRFDEGLDHALRIIEEKLAKK